MNDGIGDITRICHLCFCKRPTVMWLCGFLEILQIITRFKRIERSAGEPLGSVSLSVLFQRNCLSAAKTQLWLFEEAGGASAAIKATQVFTRLHTFMVWRVEITGSSSIPRRASDAQLPSTIGCVQDYPQDHFCSPRSSCTLGLQIFKSLLLLEQNGKTF